MLKKTIINKNVVNLRYYNSDQNRGVIFLENIFSGTSLDECLEKASQELNIPKENLKYEVLEERKVLFKKFVKISVEVNADIESDNEKAIPPLIAPNDGTVKVFDGVITIKDPKEGGRPATLAATKNVKLLINGAEVKTKTEVYENSSIEVILDEIEPKKKIDVTITEDKMEAYLTINYVCGRIFKLKDCVEQNNIILDAVEKEKVYPEKYSLIDINDEINRKGIIYGIIKDNIENLRENESVSNLLIAQGEKCKDAENDKIEIKFKIDNEIENLSQDKSGNIDFKSIGSISNVRKDDVLAIRKQGSEGQDGKDIFGSIKKHKSGKKINLKTSQGCILKDQNTVVALIDGKPCVKNNIFYVYKVHQVDNDVDLKTGNISFIGDVVINGEVKEGMKVESGNCITIKKGIERSEIIGKGDIIIEGNIISSNVVAGGQDVVKLKQMGNLDNLHKNLQELIKTIEEVKKFNLLGYDTSDGEIVKVLIENKFKQIPRFCLSIMSDIYVKLKDNSYDDEQNASRLLELIKGKLLGLAPLNIKHFSELDEIISLIENIIENLKDSLSLPVNVKLTYCQESNISSTGDIVVSGKGAYISNLQANKGIYFLQERSVVRGGSLSAENEIKCKVIGSPGGVATRVELKGEGHIYADIAYENTIFAIGNREYILDYPAKNIHVYLNEEKELAVDKFKL